MFRPGAIFGLVLAGLTAYLLFNTVEYYQEELDLGWTKEARIHPYLAAQHYIEQTGRVAFSTDNFNAIDALDDFEAIFISDSTHVLSEARMAQLVTWVGNGGHLIIGAQSLYPSADEFSMHDESTDRVLDHFEIWRYLRYSGEDSATLTKTGAAHKSNSCPDGEQCDTEVGIADTLREMNRELAEEAYLKESDQLPTPAEIILEFERSVEKELLTRLTFTGSEKPLRIFFDTDVRLWHQAMEADEEPGEESQAEDAESSSGYTPFYWQNDKHGTHFIQLYVEEGLVSVLSTAAIFSSQNIDKFEHADLWEILAGGDRNVAILYGTNMPSLWDLIKNNAPEVLFSCVLLLLAWIVFHGFRFGPIVATDSAIRRSLAEHISASGRFLWRNNHGQKLLDVAVADVNRAAELSIEAYARADEQERATLLAKKTGVDRLAVVDCFQSPPEFSEEIFLQKVSVLQTLRQRL